jgi:hypothetical protein
MFTKKGKNWIFYSEVMSSITWATEVSPTGTSVEASVHITVCVSPSITIPKTF